MIVARTSASLGADQQDALDVGLGRGDLQKGDDLAGGGQPVLDHRGVGRLQHLLHADAGVAQELDTRPGPEGAMLDAVEVHEAALRVAGGGACRVRAASVGGAVEGEPAARWDTAGGLKVGGGNPVVLGSRPGEGLQQRQAFAGALVHPGLGPGEPFTVGGLGHLDRAGRHPWAPAAWFSAQRAMSR